MHFPQLTVQLLLPAASSAWNIFSIFSYATLEVTALKNVSIVILTEAERQVREEGQKPNVACRPLGPTILDSPQAKNSFYAFKWLKRSQKKNILWLGTLIGDSDFSVHK